MEDISQVTVLALKKQTLKTYLLFLQQKIRGLHYYQWKRKKSMKKNGMKTYSQKMALYVHDIVMTFNCLDRK